MTPLETSTRYIIFPSFARQPKPSSKVREFSADLRDDAAFPRRLSPATFLTAVGDRARYELNGELIERSDASPRILGKIVGRTKWPWDERRSISVLRLASESGRRVVPVRGETVGSARIRVRKIARQISPDLESLFVAR